MNLKTAPNKQNGIFYARFFCYMIKDGPGCRCIEASALSGLDWRSVLTGSVRQGIFYPLYKNLLLSANDNIIPSEFRDEFKQTYYLSLLKSAESVSRVKRILERIEAYKIRVLFFKGFAIDALIYDDYMRPRLDVDIAAADEDSGILEKALSSLGYVLSPSEKGYPIPEYLNSRVFAHSSGDFPSVHIHRHLINNMFLVVDGYLNADMRDIWEEAEPLKGYRYILALKPELNIIYLCEHGLKHDFDQIVFLYEIDRLISYYGQGMDWNKFLRLARDSGLGRAVYYGLFLSQKVFSTDVPEGVIESLKPVKQAIGEARFIKSILESKQRRYSAYPVYLAMRKNVFGKIYFLFRTIFPPDFTLRGYVIRMLRSILP